MTDQPPIDKEQQAKQRVAMMSGARFLGLGAVMLGIAMTRGVVEGYPDWLGYVISVAGLLTFLFGPYALVRHWKGPKK